MELDRRIDARLAEKRTDDNYDAAHSCVRSMDESTYTTLHTRMDISEVRIAAWSWIKSNFPFVSFILWAKLDVGVYGYCWPVSFGRTMCVRATCVRNLFTYLIKLATMRRLFAAYWCRFFSFAFPSARNDRSAHVRFTLNSFRFDFVLFLFRFLLLRRRLKVIRLSFSGLAIR